MLTKENLQFGRYIFFLHRVGNVSFEDCAKLIGKSKSRCVQLLAAFEKYIKEKVDNGIN